MDIDPKQVQALREKTGAGMMDCKRALIEAKGNAAEAEVILRKKGIAFAQGRASRVASEGCIASYIHHGSKLGVLVEVNCETDFVARNDQFRELVKEIAQQIAATNPRWIRREDVPADVIAAERDIYAAQVKDKPPAAVEKICQGKLEKFFSTVCLIEQPFVKNPDITVKEHIAQKIAALGENIVVRRFVRWQLGEELPASGS
ncbi:MAG: translation elongation factor Ts [Verrucomicrobiae bacterium]|nr:translation elongation factor Ts [Verrucomicrobiae bacterium]MDW8343041.1 translation elongation factor Ts [Verrucomicrobiae bacterium]